MAAPENDFLQLMQRVLGGDGTAAVELLDRYGPAVRHAVRCRLSRKMRSKFDSLDFVQDVWASFFANPPGENDFPDQEKLIAFLTQVARNKVVDAARQRFVGKKYNIQREYSLDNDLPGGPSQVAASQPTPSEVFIGREQWDRLLRSQPRVYRRILILASEGRQAEEIATELGINVRTVERFMSKLLEKLTS
jgi:RNA polymerase sigma factor (sigma-70 family)